MGHFRHAFVLNCTVALPTACGGASPNVTPIGAAHSGRPLTGGHKTFSYTGVEQSFIVPTGVTAIDVIARGGAGGGKPHGKGRGGRVHAMLLVTPGETLAIFVGGAGSSSGGGFNGGAIGGHGGYDSGYGGGGASDVREGGDYLGDRILVAGGGGGQGGLFAFGRERHLYGTGGKGGGSTAGSGTNGSFTSSKYCGGGGGAGGTQSAGGKGGFGGECTLGSGNAGANGTLGIGGAGGQHGHGSGGGTNGGGGGGGGGGSSLSIHAPRNFTAGKVGKTRQVTDSSSSAGRLSDFGTQRASTPKQVVL